MLDGHSDQHQTISVSIERLFDRLEAKLDRIDRKLDSKADRTEVVALSARLFEIESEVLKRAPIVQEVASLGHDVQELKDKVVSEDALVKYRKSLLALSLTVVGLLVAIAGLLLNALPG